MSEKKTINVRGDLHRVVKHVAALRGITIEDYVEECFLLHLRDEDLHGLAGMIELREEINKTRKHRGERRLT